MLGSRRAICCCGFSPGFTVLASHILLVFVPRLASMSLPLEVLADLQLAVDGENIDIQADGDYIVVDLPSLRAGKRIVEAEPISRWRRAHSGRARRALDLVGLTLEVQLRGESIAVIGAEAEPSRIGQLLRLEGIELRPAQTLRQVARQRPFAVASVLVGLFALVGWIVARLLQSE